MIGETVFSPLLDAPLIAGPLPTVISATGVVAAVSLVLERGQRWWVRTVPVCAAAGAGVGALAAAVVEVVRPFPDPLPLRVLFWIALAAAAIGLAFTRRPIPAPATHGRRTRPARGRRDLGGEGQRFLRSGRRLPGSWGSPRPTRSTSPTYRAPFCWSPLQPGHRCRRCGTARPTCQPAGGSRTSTFLARYWVFPPGLGVPATRLRRVLSAAVAGAGDGPRTTRRTGGLASRRSPRGVMDRFAAVHDGLSPVVVVPDVAGSSLGTRCAWTPGSGPRKPISPWTSPQWLTANLQIDGRRLAIGGFSFGGTCALQLAVRRPEVYLSFLDVSGQAEPTLGDRAQTVRAAFEDEVAFLEVNPVDELRRTRYPSSAGLSAVGPDDADFRGQAQEAADAALGGGMSVRLIEFPGGHAWAMATDALDRALPWLAGRGGILDPAMAPLPQ